MPEKLVKCPCGDLYQIFDMYVGDQSGCPKCRDEKNKKFVEQQKKRDPFAGRESER